MTFIREAQLNFLLLIIRLVSIRSTVLNYITLLPVITDVGLNIILNKF